MKFDLVKKGDKDRFKYDNQFCERIIRVLYQDEAFALSVAPHLSHELFPTKIQRWAAKRIIDHVETYGAQIDADVVINAARRALGSGYFRDDERPAVLYAVKNLDRAVPNSAYVKDEVFRFVKAASFRKNVIGAVEKYEHNRQEEADQLLQQYLDLTPDPGGLGQSYTGDYKQRLRKRRRWKPNGIPTGTRLDEYLKPGGLPRKRLGCVLAPPGRGKTLTLCHMSRAAVMGGFKVLYVSMELLEEDINDRLDAGFSDVNLGSLQGYIGRTKIAIRDIKRRFGDPLRVKFFAPQTLSVAGLKGYLRRLERIKGFRPDVVFVDFADYMMSSKTYQDSYAELGLIYQELRGLAISENLAIWTASQGNRGSVEVKVVDMNSLADSFKKAGIVDLLIGFSQNPKEKIRRQARLYIAKSRLGASDVEIPIKVDAAKQRLIDRYDRDFKSDRKRRAA